MPMKEFGSLTKEPPLATLDATIRAVTPSMSYVALLQHARKHTHRDAPGLLKARFLLVDRNGLITYDHFLSIVAAYGVDSPLVRKVMYFLWAYRDERIRRFVCEQIANTAGRWRVRQLINKDNSKFFEQWVQSSTAREARSNFEFFLVETGIFDEKKRTIHLELEDGWLQHAAIAAAQHEGDALAREELLANPLQFLINREWLGLVDSDENNKARPSAILTTDAAPLEDQTITVDPTSVGSANEWNRQSPRSAGKKTAFASIDLVVRERASRSHYLLEQMIATLVRAAKLTPKWNQNIDIFFEGSSGAVLAEIKSCTDGNFHSQVRKAVSQLFEYRFLYRPLFKNDPTLLLVMEAAPPKQKAWLVNYLFSLGITMAWRDTDKLVTSCALSKALDQVVSQISC